MPPPYLTIVGLIPVDVFVAMIASDEIWLAPIVNQIAPSLSLPTRTSQGDRDIGIAL
jgi:hypothetical protein